MQNREVLLDDFPFNKMTEVLVIDNSGGNVVLWNDNLLIEAFIKEIPCTTTSLFSVWKYCHTTLTELLTLTLGPP